MADQKISLYSLADLKNTSDDAIPGYLKSLQFKQDHKLADVRLAIGYTAFAICAATFYWDYKLGFDSTKYYTAAAVAVYALLNGVLTFWIWGVEKGKVYMGTSPTGDKIEIVTSSRKHSPLYDVTVTYYKAGQPNVPHTIKFSRPFMQWFNEAGHFVALPFQQMFATEVAVIGSLDPTRAIKLDSKALSDAPSGTEPLKTVENIHATGLSASEATPTSRKGTKSRRKV